MAWTNIANANLDVGAPIRSVDILALRENISAVPNGDTGAPRIKAEALNGGQSGNAPIYAARAWVNFNGTGTVAIRASGNVSSITDNGTGDYTVNFTTAMSDANYAFTTNTYPGTSLTDYGVSMLAPYASNPTASALRVGFRANPMIDAPYFCVSIFR